MQTKFRGAKFKNRESKSKKCCILSQVHIGNKYKTRCENHGYVILNAMFLKWWIKTSWIEKSQPNQGRDQTH